jgi:hypothetical protein
MGHLGRASPQHGSWVAQPAEGWPAVDPPARWMWAAADERRWWLTVDLRGRRWWHEELAGEDPSSTAGHGVGASDSKDADAGAGRTPPPRVPPPRAWRTGHRSGRGCLLAPTASPTCTGGEKACAPPCAAMRGWRRRRE